MSKTRTICATVLATAIMGALTAYAATASREPAERRLQRDGEYVSQVRGAKAPVAVRAASASSRTTGRTMAGSSAVRHKPTGSRKVMFPMDQSMIGYNQFIVKYNSGLAKTYSATFAVDTASAAARRAGLGASAVQMRYLRKLGTGAEVLATSRRLSRAESNAFLAQLRADPSVKYAQPDFIKQRLDTVPNDPRFGELQWDFTDETAGISAPTAWDTSSGTGVVVAVLDTGYTEHADLVGNVVPGYDFISFYGQIIGEDVYPDVAGDGNGRDSDARDPGDWIDASMSAWCGGSPSDSSWHGTHVAGTVGAVANNNKDIAGVAYGAKVQPVRVLGHCGGSTSDIADAITWASGGTVAGVPVNTTPAEVLNLSLGGYGMCKDDPATQEAIDGAIARGVTVVVAAGNNGANAASYSPASCTGVITVGATGIDGAKSWFSNYGSSITLSAPGGNATSGSDGNDRWIWSLGNTGTQAPVAGAAGDNLMGFIGTSQASPHVAGVVALMQSAAVAAGNSPLTPAQVRNILKRTAKPFGSNPPLSTPMGAGIVNAAAATLAAGEDQSGETATVLSNRIALGGQGVATGEGVLYSITVPAGMRSLNLRTYGGSGDVAIYVARDFAPTTTNYERVSSKTGNAEAVVYTNPVAGTYYLRMVGVKPSSNVSVMALYQ